MAASREIYMRLLGSLGLAALAVLAPLAVPALLPDTTTRATMITVVIATEIMVLVAILAVWFWLRARRSRLRTD